MSLIKRCEIECYHRNSNSNKAHKKWYKLSFGLFLLGHLSDKQLNHMFYVKYCSSYLAGWKKNICFLYKSGERKVRGKSEIQRGTIKVQEKMDHIIVVTYISCMSLFIYWFYWQLVQCATREKEITHNQYLL